MLVFQHFNPPRMGGEEENGPARDIARQSHPEALNSVLGKPAEAPFVESVRTLRKKPNLDNADSADGIYSRARAGPRQAGRALQVQWLKLLT